MNIAYSYYAEKKSKNVILKYVIDLYQAKYKMTQNNQMQFVLSVLIKIKSQNKTNNIIKKKKTNKAVVRIFELLCAKKNQI
jgi:hypothetical protein